MTTVRLLKIHRCLLTLLALGVTLGALAQPAGAMGPPVGKTYYTIAMGLEAGYDVKAQCFEFYEDRLCTLDGLICGAWRETARARREMDLSFDLTTVDDGEFLELAGLGVLNTQGPKSSIAGTGRLGPVDESRAGSNFSFAAREVDRDECLALLEDSATGGGDGEVIVGSGILASEDREVRDFHGVVASGVGRVEIRHGTTEALRVSADDNILPLLTSEVADGLLILGVDGPFRNENDVLFEVTVRELDSLTVTGVLGVDVSGLDTARFDVNIGGVSVVTAAGRADHQEIVIAGVNRYDAGDLASRTVAIDIAGLSSAMLRVSDGLTGSCIGGARIEYIGNPTVNIQVDLVSTVRRIG